MLVLIKHRLIKIIEKIPLLQIFVYNNLQYFKFLFPHDKDYYALKLLFKKNEKRTFLDIGGNIGLSTIGFRELGFLKNKIIMFEPDRFLLDNYVSKVIKNYQNIKVYPFGLSNKSERKKLFRAFYKNVFFHFNNSFNLTYLKEKLLHNYGAKAKKFQIKKIKNSIAASDAFFPFSDGVQTLISAGVNIIVQPGGSIRDNEVIEFANKAKVKMIFTGIRHFNH